MYIPLVKNVLVINKIIFFISSKSKKHIAFFKIFFFVVTLYMNNIKSSFEIQFLY